MKTNSKNVFIVAIALVAVSLSGTFALADDFQGAQLERDGIGFYGHLEAKVTDENGNVKQYIQTDNRIVGNGTDLLITRAFSPSGGFTGTISTGIGPMTNMQLGTGTDDDATFSGGATGLQTPAAGCITTFTGTANNATLSGGFAQSSATLSATFDSSVGAGACMSGSVTNLIEAGLFNGATGSGTDDMFARGYFGAGNDVTLSGSDTLDVDWTFTFTDT